jgi:phospholipid/cholesterol/gamma-HCH transport system substrate-binding protein
MLDKVEGKADELITSFDSVLLSLNNILNAESQQHLRGVFENLDGITYELRSSMLPGGDLDESLGNLKEFSNTLASNAQNIDVMSSNLAVFTDTLAHLELNQTIKELHMVLEESKSMLETVNSAEGTAGKLVYNDSLYVNLNQVSMSLDQLLTDLKENPGRYVQFSLFGRKDKENSNNSK